MKKRLALLVLLIALLIPCVIGQTVTAYADEVENPTYYTVTFKLDENTVYDEELVKDGDYVNVPATPIADGSIFEVWMVGNEEFSFATPVSCDLVVTAKWKTLATVYTVDFMVDGEIVNTQKVIEGEKALAPTSVSVPTGKYLVGWENAGALDEVTSNLTINAILDDIYYTVNVYGLNDELLNTVLVKHGEDAVLEAFEIYATVNYAPTGYSCIPTFVTEDVDVYVEFEPVEYKVEFNLLGSIYEEQAVAYLDTATLPAIPVRDGYIFTGWYLDGYETPFDFNMEIEGETILEARFIAIEKPKYEVTFYNFDGSQYGETQQVEEGKSAIKPSDPTYEGYRFVKWAGDFSNVTENVRIYPIFTPKSYTVTFLDVNGQILSAQVVRHGKNAVEPSVSEISVPDGYEFIGWSESVKRVTKDLTVIAKVKSKIFTIIFNNDGNRVGAILYLEHGKTITPPKMDEKEGYDFIGWFDGENILTDFTATSDLELEAVYEIKTYTVNYYDGENLVNTYTVNYGETAELYLYDKTDYVFFGWFTDKELTTPYIFSKKVKSDLDLYAYWEEKPEVTYTVQFMVDGFEYGTTQIVVENGNAIAPSDPVKEGYTFTGWNTSFNNVTDDLIIEANFEINMYKVTFIYEKYDVNKQDYVVIEEVQYVPYRDSASEPIVDVRYGYDFNGWTHSFMEVKGDIVTKAIYDPNEYEVVFFDGFCVVETQIVEYGKCPTIIANPVKEGYKFAGWTLKHGEPYSFGWIIENDVEVYATWEKLTYTVYYYVNGELYQEQQVPFNEELPTYPVPELEYDEIFSGWSDRPIIMPAKPVIVTGTITKLPRYVLSYYLNGELYYSEELLEGEIILPIDPPTLNENEVFSGWRDIPSVMPDGDLTINGYITVNETRNNVIKVEIYKATDYSVAVSIKVIGNVKFAGILASVDNSNTPFTNAEFFVSDGYAEAYDGGVKFVWSNYENLTDEYVIANLYFLKDGFNAESLEFNVDEFLAIDDDGEIISTEFVVEYDNKL
jgi:uncharacterized repeat protein (TIGR02543 family)